SVFFFQAEDGIRDATVTGVQTCALPIYKRLQIFLCRADVLDLPWAGNFALDGYRAAVLQLFEPRDDQRKIHFSFADGNFFTELRSEERRVGKECSIWWARLW